MISLIAKNPFTRNIRNEYVGHDGYITGDGTVPISELRLTPKASSSGPEGTIFYDSDDDHIWVATEA